MKEIMVVYTSFCLLAIATFYIYLSLRLLITKKSYLIRTNYFMAPLAFGIPFVFFVTLPVNSILLFFILIVLVFLIYFHGQFTAIGISEKSLRNSLKDLFKKHNMSPEESVSESSNAFKIILKLHFGIENGDIFVALPSKLGASQIWTKNKNMKEKFDVITSDMNFFFKLNDYEINPKIAYFFLAIGLFFTYLLFDLAI